MWPLCCAEPRLSDGKWTTREPSLAMEPGGREEGREAGRKVGREGWRDGRREVEGTMKERDVQSHR